MSRFVKQYYEDSTLFGEGKISHDESIRNSSCWKYYDYDIQDEVLKEEIKTARQYAKKLVEEFLKSFKNVSKNAVKGAWAEAKWYVYVAIVMSLIGLLINFYNHDIISDSELYESIDGFGTKVKDDTSKQSVPVKLLPSFIPPKGLGYYAINDNAFSISVPPILELRHEYDGYTRQLQELGFVYNADVVIFQQKGLSHKEKDAYESYCRIIIQHTLGYAGDFLYSYETEYIDQETKSFLKDLVLSELGPYTLIDDPDYGWICIDSMNAIEIKYRRSGSNENTTACTMYLLFNYDEMVKMIVSYREQDQSTWLPDLDNVIKTFRWN